jgi:hypothetical protein
MGNTSPVGLAYFPNSVVMVWHSSGMSSIVSASSAIRANPASFACTIAPEDHHGLVD